MLYCATMSCIVIQSSPRQCILWAGIQYSYVCFTVGGAHFTFYTALLLHTFFIMIIVAITTTIIVITIVIIIIIIVIDTITCPPMGGAPS